MVRPCAQMMQFDLQYLQSPPKLVFYDDRNDFGFNLGGRRFKFCPVFFGQLYYLDEYFYQILLDRKLGKRDSDAEIAFQLESDAMYVLK